MNKQSIIFEGLNCTGKSSIIKHLHENVDPDIYIHNSRTPFSNVNKIDTTYGYMKAMIDVLKFVRIPIWFDRFHFTEYAYGVVKRNYNRYDQSKLFAEIDYCLNELGNVKIVYTYDEIENIVDRTKQLRGWGDIETFNALNDEMNRMIDSSCMTMLRVNYNEVLSNSDKMNELIRFVKGE